MAFPSLEGDSSDLPATTRSGIPYEIEVESLREAWVPGANKVTITARVLWVEAAAWIADMVGRATTDGTRLRRDLPEVDPFNPNRFCTRVEQIDQGGGPVEEGTLFVDGVPTFADLISKWPRTLWCKYRCTFEAMPFRMRTDAEVDDAAATDGFEEELERYVVRSRRPYAKEQQIPSGGFKTVEAVPVKLMATAFVIVPYADMTYTWVRVPVDKFLAMTEKDTQIGRINSGTFDSDSAGGGYDLGAETVLYLGYDDSNRYWDANGDWVVDVVYSFRFKGIGWNNFFKPDGVPIAVSTDGTATGGKPYATTNLNGLFRVS